MQFELTSQFRVNWYVWSCCEAPFFTLWVEGGAYGLRPPGSGLIFEQEALESRWLLARRRTWSWPGRLLGAGRGPGGGVFLVRDVVLPERLLAAGHGPGQLPVEELKRLQERHMSGAGCQRSCRCAGARRPRWARREPLLFSGCRGTRVFSWCCLSSVLDAAGLSWLGFLGRADVRAEALTSETFPSRMEWD